MTIKATRMPFDRVELHYAETTLYQEFEPEGKNMILPFNASVLEQEENGDGEVIESKRPLRIRRITKPDGKVVYKFWQLKEGGRENGKPNPFYLAQQPRGECMVEEHIKEAPKL